MKILNLILYSPSLCYDMMADVLTTYLTSKGVEHYFYSYREDLQSDYLIEGNHLYLKGRETYLPGILAKTLGALGVFRDHEYDYIVRSNVSTVIDFDALRDHLTSTPIGDYSGLAYWKEVNIDPQAGVTAAKAAMYRGCGFVSGTCIILSRRAVEMLVSDADTILSYGVIDDVAIGIYFCQQGTQASCPPDWSKMLFDGTCCRQGIVVYRNNSDSRSIDVCRMGTIVRQLLEKED